MTKEELILIINSNSPSIEDRLECIKWYVKDLKGVDIPKVETPIGKQCNTLILLAISKGMNPLKAMNLKDGDLCDYMFFIIKNYYNEKSKI